MVYFFYIMIKVVKVELFSTFRYAIKFGLVFDLAIKPYT